MNNTSTRTITLGVTLIAIGLLWWLNMWWLVVPGALVVGGVAGYVQRRNMGRTIEAVQLLVWGGGLGLLFLLDFVWPGILLLAGASLLLRGREFRADEALQTLAGRVRRPRVRARAASVPLVTTTGEVEPRTRVEEPAQGRS